MPSPIDFDYSGLAAGATATASDITDAFDLINTYFNAGIPNTDLASPNHHICITMGLEATLAAGTNRVRGLKVPAAFSTGGLVHVETQIFRTDTSGQLDVTLHDSYAEAAGDTDAKVSVQIANSDGAGTIATATTAYTFTAGTGIFVRFEATTADCDDVHAAMWFKAANRS